jgi:hypothetical protein
MTQAVWRSILAWQFRGGKGLENGGFRLLHLPFLRDNRLTVQCPAPANESISGFLLMM